MKNVEIYTETGCAICRRATLLLDELGVDYEEIVITGDRARKSEMVLRSVGKRNAPQIFIADQHVGGLEEMMAMEETGELGNLLAAVPAA